MKGLPSTLLKRLVDEILEMVNLGQATDRKLPTYSRSRKQRIGIAQALLTDPEILLIDEPTAGLNPIEVVRPHTLLTSLTGNRIVVLSTPLIGDVEALATRLATVQEGHMLTDTTPEALLAKTAGMVWSVTVDRATALQLQASTLVSAMANQLNGIALRMISAARLHEAAVDVDPTLEEAYLLATSHQRAQQ